MISDRVRDLPFARDEQRRASQTLIRRSESPPRRWSPPPRRLRPSSVSSVRS